METVLKGGAAMRRLTNIRECKALKVFYKFENAVAILSALMIIVLELYIVIARSVFQRSSLWMDEFISFLLVLLAMLGMAIGVKENSHSAMESFVCKLPRPVQTVVFILNKILIAAFLGIAIWGGYRWLGSVKGQKMIILPWPVSIMYSFVVFGCLLAFIENIISTIEAIARNECRFISIEEQMEHETEFTQSV